MATLTKGKTFTNGELVTPANLHQMVDSATVANIVNADIAANAAIADTKLATISTANKVSQSAVANLTTDLAGKAASIHQHAIADTTGLQTALDGKAAASHNHDDRYYTESEMNTLLAGKQASGSYAPASGIAPSAITGTAVITTDSRLSDARTPTTHTHDDRYYTETEIDTKLSGLPVSGHTHDDRYYTESEMNTLLAGKQASGSYAPATGIAPSAITGTAVITTDSRLSDARTPTSHQHGNITAAGAIGNIANMPVMTTTGGVLTTGFFGDLPNTFCSGTDPRLSDARQPISTHLGLVKAWVNFNHTRMLGVTNAANGESISVTAGTSSGIWNSTTAFSIGQIGIIYYITSAGAVPNASLGGINVSTLGFQIRAISGNTATIKLIAGPATTSQTITGNGGTSGFQYISYGIRAQYGVSSITKAASGSHMNFTFNFSTPFDFIDYCYNLQMDARSSGDFYVQGKHQSSIQIQVLNFSDASVSSQINFMAFGL
jgi:hypothetical protein